MKIMIITDAWDPQVNGVVRTLKQTCAELIAMGHEIEMVTPNGFKSIPCPTYPDIALSLFPGKEVARRIKEFAPEAMHIATEGPLGLSARSYAIKNDLPFSTAYHTRFPEYVKARTGIPLVITYAFIRWFHGPSMAVMAPTIVVKDDLEKYGLKNVVLWSRGVDLNIFKMQESKSLNSAHPIFLYVGRVAVEKNINAFLEIDLPGSKWVVGDGPAMDSIKEKYPNINYLGVLQQNELAKVYAAADVFVFPSRWETFGLVMIEAMACGTPVAAYPCQGPLDVIDEGITGCMREDLAQAVDHALLLDRAKVLAGSQRWTWERAWAIFRDNLVSVKSL
jgi:glycosyltransferase involved in cell wall biosynthesis